MHPPPGKMKEIALYLLDIAQNSIAAGAAVLDVSLVEREGRLTMTLADDGRGMSAALLSAVTDPFTTTRTTRKVGMGLPLLKLVCEQTGGGLTIESALGKGTVVSAVFDRSHIDCPPLGDLGETIALLVQGAPDMQLHYRRARDADEFIFRTEAVREMLGPGVSLAEPEVFLWLADYLREQEQAIMGPPKE